MTENKKELAVKGNQITGPIYPNINVVEADGKVTLETVLRKRI